MEKTSKMKPKTKRILKHMLMLLKRKRAYFWEQDGGVYYTYPKHGWADEGMIEIPEGKL
jgi:menaquinone-dependent protoporphyrinogen IX oxidase